MLSPISPDDADTELVTLPSSVLRVPCSISRRGDTLPPGFSSTPSTQSSSTGPSSLAGSRSSSFSQFSNPKTRERHAPCHNFSQGMRSPSDAGAAPNCPSSSAQPSGLASADASPASSGGALPHGPSRSCPLRWPLRPRRQLRRRQPTHHRHLRMAINMPSRSSALPSSPPSSRSRRRAMPRPRAAPLAANSKCSALGCGPTQRPCRIVTTRIYDRSCGRLRCTYRRRFLLSAAPSFASQFLPSSHDAHDSRRDARSRRGSQLGERHAAPRQPHAGN